MLSPSCGKMNTSLISFLTLIDYSHHLKNVSVCISDFVAHGIFPSRLRDDEKCFSFSCDMMHECFHRKIILFILLTWDSVLSMRLFWDIKNWS